MKNCFNVIFFIGVLMASAGVCSKQLGIYSIDPGTTQTRPAVIIQTPVLEPFSAFVYRLSDAKPELITSATYAVTTEPLRIEVPDVASDTFVEIAVTTATEPNEEDFRWRTLARPVGKKLLDYTGQQKLLPPDDFDDYWARAKKQLDAVEPNTLVTRVPEKDTSTGLLYKVELDSVEDTTIVGWFFVPRDAYKNGNPDEGVARNYPAIIITPGYGGEEPPIDRTNLGYITFSTNPRNHGPSKAYWKSPVEHLIYNITSPETYYYKLAFLDCLQAARFVFSREEVDAKRVATEGGSQGGLLAVATAMLEPRVACVAANVIAFTDYPDGTILATAGGQTQMRTLLSEAGETATLVAKSLSYCDGVNLITRVKAPVQISMGGVDPVCPYVCGIVAYNRLPKSVEKEFHVVPSAAHEVPGEMRKWNMAWYERWLTDPDNKKAVP